MLKPFGIHLSHFRAALDSEMPMMYIKFLLTSIARKAASLECPVCMEEAACPTCREEWGREGPRRNRFAEELEGMREELRAATC